jgi:DNA replication protein DnaC
VIAQYVKTAYLFIDEVGIQYGTESEQIAMFDIINGRYEYQRPTILITNLDINGLKDIMGERIIDRLRQDGGQLLAFNWKSLRK